MYPFSRQFLVWLLLRLWCTFLTKLHLVAAKDATSSLWVLTHCFLRLTPILKLSLISLFFGQEGQWLKGPWISVKKNEFEAPFLAGFWRFVLPLEAWKATRESSQLSGESSQLGKPVRFGPLSSQHLVLYRKVQKDHVK